MEKEFVPQSLSLKFKKLGFDQPCLAFYKDDQTPKAIDQHWGSNVSGISKSLGYSIDDLILAPTFNQVFTWAEENHGLYCNFIHEFYKDGVNFLWQIFWYLPVEEQVDFLLTDGTMLYGDNGEYETSRDAKIACLEKLIKILNERK